jgi:hypothetical protein
MATVNLDELRKRTQESLSRMRGHGTEGEIAQARNLVEELRNARQYPELIQLAEAISRRFPDDARSRRLYAQGLIEQGMATVAIDVLKALAARLPREHPEQAEASGLLGRAYKQIFFDARDKTSDGARAALEQAIAIYRKAFEDNEANTWHGVNLVALLTRARNIGLQVANGLKPDDVARRVIAQLDAVPAEKRDEWHLPTLAEASLGLDDWSAVEAALKSYIADDKAQAFQIASTLRQFTQVWDIEQIDDRGSALAEILRARLLALSSGELTLSPAALQHARKQPDPPLGQLEAVLGPDGAKTWKWYKTGLDRATAVCAIRAKLGGRIGTGWLVSAASLGRTPGDELLVVTNFHVINAQGVEKGITPDATEIVFEAADESKIYTVKEIVWSSPPARHDCTLLRLKEPVTGITPLPIAKSLPLVEETARVYVIGHPGGRDLQFSLQDNALLDHEGPTAGKPAIEGVWRVHYRAPTEGGSSGSPVFNGTLWEVIALHHMGGKTGMSRLNGAAGTYGANEGIALLSIAAAQAT